VQEFDNKWLNLAQQGDPEAFTRIVDAYQVSVFNLCHRMLGNPYEAEDAAQETFLRAYKSMNSYDPNRSFSTWILSIAAHYCIDQLRRKKLNITYLEDSPFLELPDPGPNPESSLSESEQQKQIRSLLNALSETDRAAVIMFYWYEFTYEEIANALNLTISAVKSRLHRARTHLAKTWTEQRPSISGFERQSYGSPAV
jgi:RNA polymerase sigma-70 factor (ECF subfamily)